jgi:hypothetical protein
MKHLIFLLVVCLGSGCATKKVAAPKNSAIVPGTHIPGTRLAAIRTPEVVKAYRAGRYTDPNYPDEMHERHTVYRREQSPDWNYLPDPPPILPNGDPSQYVDASGQLNAKQRAYAEALQEQNRAMQKRIETLQREVKKLPGLQLELDQLKQKIGEPAAPQPPSKPVPAPMPAESQDVLSGVDPELPAWEMGASDPGEFSLLPEENNQDFLLFQMRINDERMEALAVAERRKIAAVLAPPFLRRKEFAFLNQ